MSVKVEVHSINFWQTPGCWPVGTVVNRWRGPTDITADKKLFYKRLQISNISKKITSTQVTNTIRSIFSEVKFNELACGEITGGVCVVSMTISSGYYRSFMSGGLKYDKWSPGVKVRLLRRNHIEKREGTWVDENEIENFRNQPVTFSFTRQENLALPEEEQTTEQTESKTDDEESAKPKFRFRFNAKPLKFDPDCLNVPRSKNSAPLEPLKFSFGPPLKKID